jgi:glucosamine--fructose-6-phosphate aminotransferase (isomerizing)
MEYEMYREMMEQPRSLRDTLKKEKSHLKEIATQFKKFDKVYLVGCGSSLSTCYSAKDAANMTFKNNMEVYTGYEFFYHKNIDNENKKKEEDDSYLDNSTTTKSPNLIHQC